MTSDSESRLVDAVRDAVTDKRTLQIVGGGTKNFYGRTPTGDPLSTTEHTGILSYEPTELVLTARAGTPLVDIHQLLKERGQFLSCDPPQFAAGATLGGAVASGLAGPRRPWGGATRDLVLGVKLLDGRGQVLSFGGQVMKNVAGYDVARLMTGALGTLGVLLEVSIKVMPSPAIERTLTLELELDEALMRMRALARQPAPLSGAAYHDGHLYVRLSGNTSSVNSWAKKIGGEVADGDFWTRLRDHSLPFFASQQPLWRLVVPPATQKLSCEHQALLDWGGGQRWVYTQTSSDVVRQEVASYGGHAARFRNHKDDTEVFHPLDPLVEELHRGLKSKFDPLCLLNRGRMSASF